MTESGERVCEYGFVPGWFVTHVHACMPAGMQAFAQRLRAGCIGKFWPVGNQRQA